MTSTRIVNVGVLGAGAWARGAHIPGYQRDPRCRIVAIADTEIERARDAAREFNIPAVSADPRELFDRADVDMIDVCTPSHTHFELAWAALEAGKHVLCEKPVAYDYHDTIRARDLARSKGLKTKVGLTFRYSPAMRHMRELVAGGFIGTPFIFNGYEQNSQWLDPKTPLRQVDHTADQSVLQVSSLEGYGAPIIDLAHLMVGADLKEVVGTLRKKRGPRIAAAAAPNRISFRFLITRPTALWKVVRPRFCARASRAATTISSVGTSFAHFSTQLPQRRHLDMSR